MKKIKIKAWAVIMGGEGFIEIWKHRKDAAAFSALENKILKGRHAKVIPAEITYNLPPPNKENN